MVIAVIAENDVLAGIERGDDAETMPVLRHMGELVGAGFRRIAGEKPAVEENLARHHRPDAGDRFEELALAVAGNAGDADDLAGADDEGDVIDLHRCRPHPSPSRFLTSSTVRSGARSDLTTRNSTRRPTISSAELFRRSLTCLEQSPPSRRGASPRRGRSPP